VRVVGYEALLVRGTRPDDVLDVDLALVRCRVGAAEAGYIPLAGSVRDHGASVHGVKRRPLG
jgi:hypothetical protein